MPLLTRVTPDVLNVPSPLMRPPTLFVNEVPTTVTVEPAMLMRPPLMCLAPLLPRVVLVSKLMVPALTSVPVMVRRPPAPLLTWMVPSAALVKVPLPMARMSCVE